MAAFQRRYDACATDREPVPGNRVPGRPPPAGRATKCRHNVAVPGYRPPLRLPSRSRAATSIRLPAGAPTHCWICGDPDRTLHDGMAFRKGTRDTPRRYLHIWDRRGKRRTIPSSCRSSSNIIRSSHRVSVKARAELRKPAGHREETCCCRVRRGPPYQSQGFHCRRRGRRIAAGHGVYRGPAGVSAIGRRSAQPLNLTVVKQTHERLGHLGGRCL